MINNQYNNISFGARVKFSTSDVLKDLPNLSNLKKAEKMFYEQTRGINGNLNVNLYTQGRIYPSLKTSVDYKKGKYEDGFYNMKDNAIFFDDNAQPQNLVKRLKQILKFFEQRKIYSDLINQKEKEINAIRKQMKKTADKKGFSL